MAKAPQDYKRPAKKKAKVEPHSPDELFEYKAPHSGVEIELPFVENLPTGYLRRASRNAGDDQMAFYFGLMEEILGDEFEDKIDPLLQRELAEMINQWEEQSASTPGESSAS